MGIRFQVIRGATEKRLIFLDIPDNYDCMQAELIQLLINKVSRAVGLVPEIKKRPREGL